MENVSQSVHMPCWALEQLKRAQSKHWQMLGDFGKSKQC